MSQTAVLENMIGFEVKFWHGFGRTESAILVQFYFVINKVGLITELCAQNSYRQIIANRIIVEVRLLHWILLRLIEPAWKLYWMYNGYFNNASNILLYDIRDKNSLLKESWLCWCYRVLFVVFHLLKVFLRVSCHIIQKNSKTSCFNDLFGCKN